MGGDIFVTARKKAVVSSASEFEAVAALAVAMSREVDGRLRRDAEIARDAAGLVAAMRRHFEAPRAGEALPEIARIASKYGLVVQPPRGRTAFRVMFESGTTFAGIPGLYLVA